MILHRTYEPLIKYLESGVSTTCFLYGGYGSGKSHIAAFYILYRLLHYEGRYNIPEHIVCLRKNYSDTRKSQIDFILKIADLLQVRHLLVVQKSHPVSITTTFNKSKITTAGTSDTQNFKSVLDVTCVWLEEATQIDFADWLVISSQIRVVGTPLLKLLTFNPIDEDSWLNKKYFEPSDINLELNEFKAWVKEIEVSGALIKENYCALKVNYKINKEHLSQKTIAEYEDLKILSPRAYQIGVLGDWGTLYDEGIFKYEKIPFTSSLSMGVGNVIYADVNLSKKGKGDYTAILKLSVDIQTQKYNIIDYRCFNCREPADLIESILMMRDSNTMSIGYDSHYGQGNHWEHHIRQYCIIKNIMQPAMNGETFSVNALSLNAEILFNSGRILFPDNMKYTVEGKRSINQLISFTGIKKDKEKDDFADCLICSIALAEKVFGKFYTGYKKF